MPQTSPYQPILLRILHCVTVLLIFSALISGFWVYNSYDGRWGSLPLPKVINIQDIHGTVALTFLLFLPVFAFYSFRIGYRRLIQDESLRQLKQVGKPIWWISIHRVANTMMLLSATFAVITGRMMDEVWLPKGELDRGWYVAHLLAWLCMLVSIAIHVLLAAKIGGFSLIVSMFNWQRRYEDRLQNWLEGMIFKHSSLILKVFEVIVIGGIIVAFILPALKYLG